MKPYNCIKDIRAYERAPSMLKIGREYFSKLLGPVTDDELDSGPDFLPHELNKSTSITRLKLICRAV